VQQVVREDFLHLAEPGFAKLSPQGGGNI
jgi:hypothetical protein